LHAYLIITVTKNKITNHNNSEQLVTVINALATMAHWWQQ